MTDYVSCPCCGAIPADWTRDPSNEIERLREFVSGLACDCEGEQCKVYGEDCLRFGCGYRKARAALGEKE